MVCVSDVGLIKLENIIDGDLVLDLITAFIDKYVVLCSIMRHYFKDMTLSYNWINSLTR